MDSIRNKIATIKFPKMPRMEKLRKWHEENMPTNVSALVNRYLPQNASKSKQHGEAPAVNTEITGISTVSGRIIEQPKVRDKSKDNYGLHALKTDRNAAKKGLVLAIPLPKKHRRSQSTAKALVHEKFATCERKSTDDNDSESINECEEEIIRIELEEEEEEDYKPPVPPRRHAKPVLPRGLEKNQSELYRLKRAETRGKLEMCDEMPENLLKSKTRPGEPETRPEGVRKLEKRLDKTENRPQKLEEKSLKFKGGAGELREKSEEHGVRPRQVQVKQEEKKITTPKPRSIDIFKKEEADVFREFDSIFPKVSQGNPRKPPMLKSVSSSFSSSIEESYEEVKRKAMGRRFSATIKVQDLDQVLPRCRSIVSPQHVGPSSESSLEVTEKPKPKPKPNPKPLASILKQPSVPKLPPPDIEIPVRTVSANVDVSAPQRKFFIYYNDEDELVFNQQYGPGAAGPSVTSFSDALFKHYNSNSESSSGIFI